MHKRVILLFIVLLLIQTLVFCEVAEISENENNTWRHFSLKHEALSHEITLPESNLFFPQLPIFTFSQDRQLGLYSYVNKPKNYQIKTSMIWLVDLQSGEVLKNFAGHPDSTQSLAFSSDAKITASGGREGILRLWDNETDKEINSAKGHKDYIRAVAYSPNDEQILSGGDDREILLWDIKTMEVQRRFQGHTSGIRCIEFSKDGKSFLSGSWDGSIRLWETHTN